MTKRKNPDGVPAPAGNASSEIQPGERQSGQVRPWTAEEMAGAKPFPLPEVESTQLGISNPVAGAGQTKAAGRPDKDESTH